MNTNDLTKITEQGISELGLEWPPADSIFELRIHRAVYYSKEAEPRPVTNPQEYLDFLYLNVFPLVDQLEDDAGIKYWHILNHENLDLRLSIQDENNMKTVKRVLAEHVIAENPLTKWGTYRDPNLGSRLGCQALLHLYNAQSKFVRDLVRAIWWLRNKSDKEEIKVLISNMTYTVPIYTSHMLLNIFPADPYYEGIVHLDEGESRLRHLLKRPEMPKEAEMILDKIKTAKQELRNLLKA